MKMEKLVVLQESFLELYPEGFESEALQAVAKKHKMEKMKTFVKENFGKEDFDDSDDFMVRFTKLISMSSLVSVFEKTRFKDCARSFSEAEKMLFSKGVYEFLYGDQGMGFSMQIEVLDTYKMAKWPILTVLGVYMRPETEVLVKPTTVKAVLNYFEVEDFAYASKPNYEFYARYRDLVNKLKKETGKILQVDNAAYCGFLMMTIR